MSKKSSAAKPTKPSVKKQIREALVAMIKSKDTNNNGK